MTDNTRTDAAKTAIDFTEVEQPMQRRGTVTVAVTVEGHTTSTTQPSAEQVAGALAKLAKGQSIYVVLDEKERIGVYVSIAGVKLA